MIWKRKKKKNKKDERRTTRSITQRTNMSYTLSDEENVVRDPKQNGDSFSFFLGAITCAAAQEKRGHDQKDRNHHLLSKFEALLYKKSQIQLWGCSCGKHWDGLEGKLCNVVVVALCVVVSGEKFFCSVSLLAPAPHVENRGDNDSGRWLLLRRMLADSGERSLPDFGKPHQCLRVLDTPIRLVVMEHLHEMDAMYRSVSGMLFVFDAGNVGRLGASRDRFQHVMSAYLAKGVPILLLANKADLATTLPAAELESFFSLSWIVAAQG